jgi:catechol 2,3-dioxygenase-like lactoylglutathione lyase family enzyme
MDGKRWAARSGVCDAPGTLRASGAICSPHTIRSIETSSGSFPRPSTLRSIVGHVPDRPLHHPRRPEVELGRRFSVEGLDWRAALDGPREVTFIHVVDTEDQVIAVLNAAQAAGGTIFKPPSRAEFGGFHGYFADPAGFRCEIATNPGWSVDTEGTVTIGRIER